ncbi:DUF721 domain-containing protein [Caldimonas thermodepolymerans]|jgi:Protein of unknown function (DUF721).|uniref:DUF721 domain-containing protein n=1 Tax=Caldimonas thermodepolymerans TaxID=215580 RepID=A0A2S5T1V1_9BURK|nr:DciA family protein [Caldimonas thermodepolymerans]PPE68995.1 hypothetical protein C1702_14100 [Caldimonas thermodepolymerans]QPC32295.1 DUF721 domain-containing protein [Caldimonas thermodepolymerans]UZG45096.1 DUF721 domain-containing protein [Caldimonas thermodepolymerans]UZG48842.1 DUF721 domain-containing protein [Caldimonas thermodepolymerans]
MNQRAPHTLPIQEALDRHAGLARLQQLMRESSARFEVVRPLLPPALAAHVKPGPVDEQGWSLLAPNGAAAAKLRQLQPRLEEALRQRGWQVSAIRVKVQSG